jgi:ABC-type transport system substrate-binding protein
VQWSDGQPVTAADVKFTYDALASTAVQSPFRDRAAAIERMETPDPATVVVTLRSPACSALHTLRRPLLPSHRYAAGFSDLATNPLNQAPTVGAGPFLFVERTPAAIVLARNPGYWKGAPQAVQWTLHVLPEAAARRQALLEGSVDLAHVDPAELLQNGLPNEPSLTTYAYPADAYSVLALNLADPANPQSGVDAAGQPVAQSPHPILGNQAVRQVIAEAVDVDRLLADAFRGQGYRLTGYVLPTIGWAYAEQPRVAHDPARAAQRLAAAGWVDGDGDGVREANGLPLRLAHQTNGDNALRVALAEQVASQLRQVGFQIDVSLTSFEELTTVLLAQQFDLVVIGWENIGADPGNNPFWSTSQDLPGQGFNFASVRIRRSTAGWPRPTRLPAAGWTNAARSIVRCSSDLTRCARSFFWAGIRQSGSTTAVGQALRQGRGGCSTTWRPGHPNNGQYLPAPCRDLHLAFTACRTVEMVVDVVVAVLKAKEQFAALTCQTLFNIKVIEMFGIPIDKATLYTACC